MKEFLAISRRIEGQPRKVTVGPKQHPATELYARMSALHSATMDAEQVDADGYFSQYVGFAKLLDLSFKFLQRKYDAELSLHGFVRIKKQGLTKMQATIDSPANITASSEADSPTKEMLAALLQNATNCEPGAITELLGVTVKHPELFTGDFDLLELVKRAFYSLAASRNCERSKLVKSTFERNLEKFGQLEGDPICQILFRHMAFYSAVAQFNLLLSMAPSQPSRTNEAILKRSSQCSLKLEKTIGMYKEYMTLKSNEWATLPGGIV